MNTRLQHGDRFPDLSIQTVGGDWMVLPRDVEGFHSVILFYRGAWSPYCRAQLAAFARARASLRASGVEIVAVSVDDETGAAALAEDAACLQSTGFVLDKRGRILTAVYSSGAIGRLVPEDVAGFVRDIESHDAVRTPAETRP